MKTLKCIVTFYIWKAYGKHGVFPFNPQAIKEEYLQQSAIQTELTLEEDKEEPSDSCSSQTSTTLPTIATTPHSSVPVEPQTHTSTTGCTENKTPQRLSLIHYSPMKKELIRAYESSLPRVPQV
ncbi:hypothetical protein HOLleu_05092 [Holothuria leucospilota]|uniref:Uncharacterized protein n=1 Tax=Holothuria leucospilota TaxID=206669 RepID=A0A9Q1CJJ5_HOLLE|nr:hypothetical protein HOLleu_05092 [Holothuria leucospilota]